MKNRHAAAAFRVPTSPTYTWTVARTLASLARECVSCEELLCRRGAVLHLQNVIWRALFIDSFRGLEEPSQLEGTAGVLLACQELAPLACTPPTFRIWRTQTYTHSARIGLVDTRIPTTSPSIYTGGDGDAHIHHGNSHDRILLCIHQTLFIWATTRAPSMPKDLRGSKDSWANNSI